MRAAVLALLLLGACGPERRQCTTSAQCRLDNGALGSCIETSCAFDDPSCASGMRFDVHAEHHDECVPGADAPPAVDAAEAIDGAEDAPPADTTPADTTNTIDAAPDAA